MKLASNRQITEKVCFASGHKIESLLVRSIVDPQTKTVVPVYEVLCIQCGLELKKIRNYRPYISREEILQRKEQRKQNGNDTKS